MGIFIILIYFGLLAANAMMIRRPDGSISYVNLFATAFMVVMSFVINWSAFFN